MSLINTVLQDLDQRQGMAAPDGKLPPQQVRVVQPEKKGREWFWRTVAALMIAALGWVGWVVYQLQPRTLATELAFKAAEDAKRGAAAPVVAAAPVKPAEKEDQKAVPPASATEKQAAAPRVDKTATPDSQPSPAVRMELFKLAFSIDTPFAQRPRGATAGSKAGGGSSPAAAIAPSKASTQTALAPSAASPAAESAPAAGATAPRVEKRDRARSPADRAESEFRRGVGLLNQGRISEAEEALAGALAIDPSHAAARQALVALSIEQRRYEDARRLLQEALALNPDQPQFAMVLARLFAERREYPAALDTLAGVKSTVAGGAEYNALMGAVLQRLSRHREAVDAFQIALRAAPQNGASWVSLGISLEALQRKPEAADAFRRAVATGTLGADVRAYAEQRARQLQ